LLLAQKNVKPHTQKRRENKSNTAPAAIGFNLASAPSTTPWPCTPGYSGGGKWLLSLGSGDECVTKGLEGEGGGGGSYGR
jgi:hypothetical protein